MALQSARSKGHGLERRLAKRFRELGYNCTTSRLSSRALDSLGVDLCGTGCFYIQAKAVEKLSNLHTVLANMPEHGKINVVAHKRNRQGTLIAMSEDDFFTLVKQMLDAGVITTEC